MESEFDKEINSLLRQAARSGAFVTKNFDSHIDADEISLFAENVLPAKSRVRVTEHLADCNRCRKILSQFVSLDPENEIIKAPDICQSSGAGCRIGSRVCAPYGSNFSRFVTAPNF